MASATESASARLMLMRTRPVGITPAGDGCNGWENRWQWQYPQDLRLSLTLALYLYGTAQCHSSHHVCLRPRISRARLPNKTSLISSIVGYTHEQNRRSCSGIAVGC
ncbi:hypothetical protein FVEG_15197 [Fusarium verticillioides 7600]|uniref:Uncharacterized protein n=1 Tax=Gibberella moniliformis (strain M3125 / FGSC 7600) TaxID=334819 RepID=W7LNG4_GIBM7|nr:hypothetical protein FVEG_15197 [Fusarium verticillioides 7600]EWG40928.1 hypothetical protein FVEG_15197 [Fusarium verticillioides 7600]